MRAALAVSDDHDEALAMARGGDPGAFAAVVRRHQAMVFSLALHALRSRAAAEDLAQEVFLELYRSLARIESPMRMSSPGCAGSRAIAASTNCGRPRHRIELAVDALPDRGAAPAMREPFLAARLQELVARLPARARLVVVLRYQEELEPSEIGDALNMPVNTVKSHLRRSLALLRANLLKEGQP